MDKTSGRNFVIQFFPKYLAISQKSSKTVIALEGKPISPYLLRLFLLSLGLTYGRDITSKAISKLVTLPRQSRENFLILNPKKVLNTCFLIDSIDERHFCLIILPDLQHNLLNIIDNLFIFLTRFQANFFLVVLIPVKFYNSGLKPKLKRFSMTRLF
jgi:hypothetical protein